eukprot:CAMPEP_0115738924 /NCGR_PEP_ID=MMETSP0272-20121206/88644_1 /TAXON_ID=71861 /ORGANISM="Scrippsiella trochoidea, Strain CCMP3099" /LENGTH=37 /DNA_ID= /DNA_START= /DNA_END= /DNA_ORIENTATION=
MTGKRVKASSTMQAHSKLVLSLSLPAHMRMSGFATKP